MKAHVVCDAAFPKSPTQWTHREPYDAILAFEQPITMDNPWVVLLGNALLNSIRPHALLELLRVR
jgi:hypothetical protein